MPNIAQIERQIENEIQASDRGVERYKASLKDRDLVDTAPGSAAMQACITDVIDSINRKQIELGFRFIEGARGPSPCLAYLLALSPEKLAIITARTILTIPRAGEVTTWRVAINVAQRIGNRVVAECEFEKWRKASAAAAKNKEDSWDAAHWLVNVARKVDFKSWQRWKRKRNDITEIKVTPVEAIKIGDVLLWCAAQTEWFSMDLKYTAARKTRKTIAMGEKLLKAITVADERLAVCRPYFMPMVCEPKPWKQQEAQ